MSAFKKPNTNVPLTHASVRLNLTESDVPVMFASILILRLSALVAAGANEKLTVYILPPPIRSLIAGEYSYLTASGEYKHTESVALSADSRSRSWDCPEPVLTGRTWFIYAQKTVMVVSSLEFCSGWVVILSYSSVISCCFPFFPSLNFWCLSFTTVLP